jgi:heme exporter protein A
VGAATNLLEVSDVEVRRGERLLIRDLSFGLAAGQMALVIGPNGGGKTSLLRIVAGLAPCTAGNITFDGTAIHRMSPEQRADIAYRGHLDGLKKDLTVLENLRFYSALHGCKPDLDGLLTDLGLQGLGERPLRYLSAGQRRRTGLAVLKATRAKLWILDEPMTNLDAQGRSLVARWLGEHLGAGGLALVATHQPDELASNGSLLVEI